MRCPSCGHAESVEAVRSPARLPPGDDQLHSFVRCTECRLLYLSPPIVGDDLERFYGETYLPFRGPKAWGRWAFLVRAGLRREARARVRMVERFARPEEGARVLDVGCGRALFLRELVRRTRATAVGIDRTDRPWRDEPESLAGIELVSGNLPEALPPGPFAVVTLWQVLEHFDRPAEVLRELRKRAGAGATLVAEVPDHSAWTRILQGPFWAGYDPPRHVSVFEPETLRSTVERAGWKTVRCVRRGGFDPWVLWWLGQQARAGKDLSGSLESRLPPFLVGKVLTWPLVAATRGRGLGIQTIFARAVDG